MPLNRVVNGHPFHESPAKSPPLRGGEADVASQNVGPLVTSLRSQ